MKRTLLARRLLLAGGAIAPLVLTDAVRGQTTLPDKSTRLLVGSSAAGGEDKMARSIAPRLEGRIGRHVAVDNKPHPNGSTVGEVLAKGPKDGSVIALIGSEVLAGALTVAGYPFDPMKDIVPITLIGGSQTGLAVASSTGVSTLPDFLEWLKAGGPERSKIGHHGCPSFVELFDKIIEQKTGMKLEPVAYRGAAPMVNDLATGRLPACLTSVTSLLEHHRGPRLKIVMSSAAERSKLAPNVPTAVELGYPELQVGEWFGFFVAAGAPAPLIEEWNRHIAAVVVDGEVKAELFQLGLEVAPTSVADAGPIVTSYMQDWQARLQAAGIKPPG